MRGCGSLPSLLFDPFGTSMTKNPRPPLLLALFLAGWAEGICAQPQQEGTAPEELARTVNALDREIFDAYNRCDLAKFGSYFSADVEFYHDQSGLMRSRESVVEATKKFICGKVRRELVQSTVEVYPMKGYGALQMGTHRFCELTAPKCGGVAKFVHLWQNDGGAWRITRVISYDHQAL
jgi:hypothetical protein